MLLLWLVVEEFRSEDFNGVVRLRVVLVGLFRVEGLGLGLWR